MKHLFDQIREKLDELEAQSEPAYCECRCPDHVMVETFYRDGLNALRDDEACGTCRKPINPVWTWKPGNPRPSKMPKGCRVSHVAGNWDRADDGPEHWNNCPRRWNILENPDVYEPAATPAIGGPFYEGVEWLACWLLDNCEGEEITEEQLRPWAAKAWDAHISRSKYKESSEDVYEPAAEPLSDPEELPQQDGRKDCPDSDIESLVDDLFSCHTDLDMAKLMCFISRRFVRVEGVE